mgnify:CR=1 FL=1
MTAPKVAILMGSDSDYEKIEALFKTLSQFGIPFTARVMSAHRTPAAVHELASQAEAKGIQVMICAAGMAAHLAGVVASQTILPVIGLPIKGGAVDGLDAILSTLMMPPGIPVATVGLNAGENAALLAAQIVARTDEAVAAKLRAHRADMAKKVAEKDAALQKKIQS